MTLKSLFIPEVIKKFHSDFNGDIILEKFQNNYRLEVGGLTQSGDVMVWVWSSAIKNILPPDFFPKSILMLGLGGGSAIFWLRKKYKSAKITIIEIDPVMIKIAKEYFKVDQLSNIQIIKADAVEYIKKINQKFDLVLMDCYQGFQTPAGFDNPSVLRRMKKAGGIVLINRLYWDEHKLITDNFVNKISKHFKIISVYTQSNLVISLIDKASI